MQADAYFECKLSANLSAANLGHDGGKGTHTSNLPSGMPPHQDSIAAGARSSLPAIQAYRQEFSKHPHARHMSTGLLHFCMCCHLCYRQAKRIRALHSNSPLAAPEACWQTQEPNTHDDHESGLATPAVNSTRSCQNQPRGHRLPDMQRPNIDASNTLLKC